MARPTKAKRKNARSYQPPKVESESIFETRALACGKCRTGPHRQHACMRMPSTS